jgi:hypothetical protein
MKKGNSGSGAAAAEAEKATAPMASAPKGSETRVHLEGMKHCRPLF